MSFSYWEEALCTAVYLMNRTPSRVLDFHTPLHTLCMTMRCPPISSLPLWTFGCVYFVRIHKKQPHKLAPRALKCLFLGYATQQKGYKCYRSPTRKIFITMDAFFHEEKMYFAQLEFQEEENQEDIMTLDYELQENYSIDPTSYGQVESLMQLREYVKQ